MNKLLTCLNNGEEPNYQSLSKQSTHENPVLSWQKTSFDTILWSLSFWINSSFSWAEFFSFEMNSSYSRHLGSNLKCTSSPMNWYSFDFKKSSFTSPKFIWFLNFEKIRDWSLHKITKVSQESIICTTVQLNYKCKSNPIVKLLILGVYFVNNFILLFIIIIDAFITFIIEYYFNK